MPLCNFACLVKMFFMMVCQVTSITHHYHVAMPPSIGQTPRGSQLIYFRLRVAYQDSGFHGFSPSICCNCQCTRNLYRHTGKSSHLVAPKTIPFSFFGSGTFRCFQKKEKCMVFGVRTFRYEKMSKFGIWRNIWILRRQ